MVFPTSWISLLVVMNLSLQVWDGLATYYGLSQEVQEGNPFLRPCMAYWGVGVTLVGAKSAACVLLVYRHESSSLCESGGAHPDRRQTSSCSPSSRDGGCCSGKEQAGTIAHDVFAAGATGA